MSQCKYATQTEPAAAVCDQRLAEPHVGAAGEGRNDANQLKNVTGAVLLYRLLQSVAQALTVQGPKIISAADLCHPQH